MAGSIDNTVFLISFAAYTLAIVAVGLYSARFSKRSDEDYFLAGRTLGPWIAAFSASASSESGWVTLGLVGWAFTNGVQAYWIIPGCLLGFLFNWFVIAGPLRDRSSQLGAVTLPDFFSFAFGERKPWLRVTAVIVILTAMLLYVAAQLAAAGKAFSASFGGVDYRVGVLIGATVVLLYTVVGGFRAVCWTDFLQALLMIGTLVIFPVYLLIGHGGFGFISTELAAIDGDLLRFTPQKTGIAFLGFLFGAGALGINFGYPGQPHVLIRFMALRDRRDARLGGVISACWAICVYAGAVTIGLIARALASSGAPWGAQMLTDPQYQELGLVLAAKHLLPSLLAGLVLAAVLAAICSTADSQLVVAASAAANDLYARIFQRAGSKSHVWINRATVFGLGLCAVLLVINEQLNVYQYVLTYGWAILGAAFGPQLILLLFWRRASYAGCLAGMITGFAVAIVWQNTYGAAGYDVEVYNLPLAFVCALTVNLGVSVLTPGSGSAKWADAAVESVRRNGA